MLLRTSEGSLALTLLTVEQVLSLLLRNWRSLLEFSTAFVRPSLPTWILWPSGDQAWLFGQS